MVSKSQHIELVQAVLRTSMPKTRWCMKNQVMTNIENFQGGSFKCWACDYHVTNGNSDEAICDPI